MPFVIASRGLLPYKVLRGKVCAFIAMLLRLWCSSSPTAARSAQDKPRELPAHLEGVAPDQNFASAKAVTLSVTSRRPEEDPSPPHHLERIRNRALETSQKIGLSVVADKSSADFQLEIIVEPHVRLVLYHSQNSPYVFLTLRESSNGRMVYCTLQRSGILQCYRTRSSRF